MKNIIKIMMLLILLSVSTKSFGGLPSGLIDEDISINLMTIEVRFGSGKISTNKDINLKLIGIPIDINKNNYNEHFNLQFNRGWVNVIRIGLGISTVGIINEIK